jgi:DNA transformation protein
MRSSVKYGNQPAIFGRGAIETRRIKFPGMAAKPKREPPEHIRTLGKVLPVESRAMFGGYGIYSQGVFFALFSSQGVLYFRVGDSNRADFEKAGSEPFMPYSRVKSRAGERVIMPYFAVPDGVLAKPALLRTWAEKALEAALTARGARKPKGGTLPAAGEPVVKKTATSRRAAR